MSVDERGSTRRTLRAVETQPLTSRVLRRGQPRIVAEISDAVEAAIDAVYHLRGCVSAIDDSLPADCGLVLTPLGIVCAPDEPRCVALTTRGDRCANRVFDKPGWSGGVLATLHEPCEGFPSQLCRVHRRTLPGRSVPVEWFLVAEAALWGELVYL